jgi:6-phosphogluconolactonase
MERTRPILTIVPDIDALAQAAANRISARFTQPSDQFAFCLTGGSTPEPLYALLATKPYRDALPWDRIHLFWGDDRFVPQDDPRSNFGAARRLLLDRIPVPPGNVHPISTGAGSAEEAARLYEAELRRAYGAERLVAGRALFDVVLMGVGDDGHTASLFPGHAELDEKERWVVAVAEAGLAPFVPRVTLTFPALASSREMLFLVSGPGKKETLARLLAGADLPAARAYSVGDIVWLVDRDAAPERSHAA